MKAMICVLVVGFLVGCGGGSGTGPGGGSYTPTVHPLDAGAKRATLGVTLIVPLGALPTGATVTYSIVDMPTGIGDDTLDFSIASEAEARAGGNIEGFGVRTGVSSTGATTPALPADDYALVAICQNTFDDCFFSSTVTGTY